MTTLSTPRHLENQTSEDTPNVTLRNGNADQAHYDVRFSEYPNMYAMFQRPGELTEDRHEEFRALLHDMHNQLQDVVADTFHEENRHMTPQLNAILPGTYLSQTSFSRQKETEQDFYHLLYSCGLTQIDMRLEDARTDMESVRNALQTLLHEVRTAASKK